jgi:DNA-binding transcriptional LysR family regulator
MDRLGAIRLFVRLVELGGFTAVARAEGIGQPAVSKQIHALERYLGAQLVSRTSRQVVVTEAGQTFYESAKQLVDDFDAAESSVGDRQHSPRGLIRLSTAPAHGRLCITPLLPEFLRRYPGVQIQVSASERQVDLIGEGIDLAVRHGAMQDSSFVTRKLSESPFVLVASPAYLARRPAPSQLAELDGHDCVVFAHGQKRYTWSFKVGRQPVPYTPQGSFITGDAEQIRAGVLCGLGISQVPLWLVAAEIDSGEVQVLLPDLQPEPIPIHLVHPAGRRVPTRVKVLIEYLVQAFAS